MNTLFNFNNNQHGLIPVLLILIALVLAGCADPLSSTMNSDTYISTASEGSGSLIIRLYDTSSTVANTIKPELANAEIDSYVITLTGSDGTVISDAITSSSAMYNLNPDTYTVKVDALDTDGTVIADGDASVTIADGQSSSVTITLDFIDGEGNGTITLSFAFPADSVASVTGTLDDEELIFTLSEADSDGLAHATTTINKPSGTYTLIAILKNAQDMILSTMAEKVKILGNVAVVDTITIASDELNGAPLAPTPISAKQVDVDARISWVDISHVETGFEIERSSDNGSSWIVLDSALAANTVSYTDTSVTKGSSYKYRVRAVNSFGESEWTVSSNLTIVDLISVADDDLTTADGNFYEGIAEPILISDLTGNDTNHLNTDPIGITAVTAVSNCTVSLGTSSISFTGTAAGSAASFTYTARVEGTTDTATATVTIANVQDAPPLIANTDGPYDIEQGETVSLVIADKLISNDVLPTGSTGTLTFDSIVSGTSVNCSAVLSSDRTKVLVTSTGLAYESASFQYNLTDGASEAAVGTVKLNVTPLPATQGYLFTATEKDTYDLDGDNNKIELAFDAMKNYYKPASMSDIVNTWARFQDTSYYWESLDSIVNTSSTAYTWTLIADEDGDGYIDGDTDGDGTDDNNTYFDTRMGNSSSYTRIYGDIDGDGFIDERFMQTQNGSRNGFISPDKYANYTHEVTLWSADPSDDDMLGVVVAFERTATTNNVLWVGRTRDGVYPYNNWGLYYNTTQIADFAIGTTGGNWGGISSGTPDSNSTDDYLSRVKIVREGDTITAVCTDWITGVENYSELGVTGGSYEYLDESLITIDLANDQATFNGSTVSTSDLSGFEGESAYGYTNYSQAMSTYLDVNFDGGASADTIIKLTGGDGSSYWDGSEVWKYQNGSWEKQTGLTAQDELGYVREVTNPLNNLTYLFKQDQIELVLP